ncbi:hypothetical protein [Desulfovibrio aminophilus]|uniref:hypothetical protein n=1 Tax=Desulfovibrio aminophilus TaxID=81425 RepID=UPI003396533B
MPHLNMIRIHYLIAALSLILALTLTLSLISALGLSGREVYQVLSGKQLQTIYLNSQAFRSSAETPNAAWFVFDRHSLSSILDHDYKAYASEAFNPRIPKTYPSDITLEAQMILVGCAVFFLVILLIAVFVLSKFIGREYAYQLYEQARANFGDPAALYKEEIRTLKNNLAASTNQMEKQEQELKIYRQEQGPIKTVVKYMTKEEQQVLRRLGISPEEYFAKKASAKLTGQSSTPKKPSF